MTARKGAGLEAAATDLEAQKNVGNDNARSSKPQPQNPQAAPKSWRDVVPIHPAAETATGFVVTAPAHFQQAKTDGHTSHFLQIVAKPKRSARKKPEPKLTRVAFKVSRLMEFCSERELQNQTGHPT